MLAGAEGLEPTRCGSRTKGPSARKTPQCGVFSEAGRSPWSRLWSATGASFTTAISLSLSFICQMKSHPVGWLFIWQGQKDSNPLVCGLAQVAALRLHRSLIHSRDQGSSLHSGGQIKNHPQRVVFYLAGAEGLEPSRTVLETAMLPLHPAPIIRRFRQRSEYSTPVPCLSNEL